MSAKPLLVLLFAFMTTFPSVGIGAIVCPPMPDAITKVNKDVASDVKASVGTLGRLKAGEVTSKTEVVAKNLFERYPNADRLLVLQMMGSTYCSMLKDNTYISENDRQKLWAEFQKESFSFVNPGPPPPPRPNEKPKQKPAAASARELLASIGDTGWIFVGYFNVNSKLFIEGPYISVRSQFRGIPDKFVEIGNTVTLDVSRKVYLVDFRKTGAEKKLKSPISKSIMDKDDETGITLPANTKLTVRDVSEGKWENVESAALWIRVVAVAE
ncbi:hypothetical protein [Nitrosospira sp. Is2]|uniref:hypothetical protein n=1 Tax=Nitrosospira sp. Is2 TaxID=3080532 RepID=UPI002952D7DE|nr:hypothetical protein [Nitrosospira sp. Is2]WON75238.1 hypothetical protein R5L00_07110 [Nitrosospira sp. Is2]